MHTNKQNRDNQVLTLDYSLITYYNIDMHTNKQNRVRKTLNSVDSVTSCVSQKQDCLVTSNQKLLTKFSRNVSMSKKQTKRVAVNEVALYNAIAVTEHDAITAQSDSAFSEIEHQKNINTNLLSELDALKSTLAVAEKNMATLSFENESLLDRLEKSIDVKEYKKNVLYTSLRFNDRVVEHHYSTKEFIVDSKNCHDQKYNRMYSLLEKDVMNCDVYFEADYATYQHNLYNSQIKKHNKLQLRFEDIIQE